MPYKDKNDPRKRESERRRSLARYHANRDVLKEKHRLYEARIKEQVFLRYGGYVCACCGDVHKPFLTIDHINGGGTKHRKEAGGGGKFTYMWIHRNKYPDGFRVLCFNCNSGRAQNKNICPHEEERKLAQA